MPGAVTEAKRVGLAWVPDDAEQKSLLSMEPSLGVRVVPAGHLGLFATREDQFMSSTGDKIKGVADQAMGAIKQGVGNVVGSDKLKVEGKVQEIQGKAEVALGKTKDAIKKGANAAADAINKKL